MYHLVLACARVSLPPTYVLSASERAPALPCPALALRSAPPPLDADEVREAVGEALLRRPPAALVRLVGRSAYSEGAQDVYEMMQSAAFMRQLGYGVLEIAALHLCPELKALFNELERGAGVAPGQGAA